MNAHTFDTLGMEGKIAVVTGGTPGRARRLPIAAPAASAESGLMTGSIIDFDQQVLGCADSAPQPPPVVADADEEARWRCWC